MAERQHIWDDDSGYCTGCGFGRIYQMMYDPRRYGCAAGPDIIAISHLLVHRRRAEVVRMREARRREKA